MSWGIKLSTFPMHRTFGTLSNGRSRSTSPCLLYQLVEDVPRNGPRSEFRRNDPILLNRLMLSAPNPEDTTAPRLAHMTVAYGHVQWTDSKSRRGTYSHIHYNHYDS